jgi:hypothetical protein
MEFTQAVSRSNKAKEVFTFVVVVVISSDYGWAKLFVEICLLKKAATPRRKAFPPQAMLARYGR